MVNLPMNNPGWSEKLLGREAQYVRRALVAPRHYQAMLRIGTKFERPGRTLWNYLTRSGTFPAEYRVRTPIGPIALRLYSVHDLLTLNEIFARNDYKANGEDKVIVDIGSNIGVSTAYFLSRSLASFVYAYEPVPTNIGRLRDNLTGFDQRYLLNEIAVGTAAGRVAFGVESTGRYGGVGLATGESIEVECVRCNDIVEALLLEHGQIDIFKADVEGYEERILRGLEPALLRRMRKIFVECTFQHNPIPATHHFRQYGSVAQFWLRS
jgi:FkbM family methyltransferase